MLAVVDQIVKMRKEALTDNPHNVRIQLSHVGQILHQHRDVVHMKWPGRKTRDCATQHEIHVAEGDHAHSFRRDKGKAGSDGWIHDSGIGSCVEHEVEGSPPAGVQGDYNQCAVDKPEVKIRFSLEVKPRSANGQAGNY